MARHISQAVQQRIGRLNAARRWNPDANHTELEQELAACQISEHARKIMAGAPALTPEQSTTLVTTLTDIIKKRN